LKPALLPPLPAPVMAAVCKKEEEVTDSGSLLNLFGSRHVDEVESEDDDITEEEGSSLEQKPDLAQPEQKLTTKSAKPGYL
jgi:hypothetical protein